MFKKPCIIGVLVWSILVLGSVWIFYRPSAQAREAYDLLMSLNDQAKKEQITFLPGSACYPTEQENHHLRISFSYMKEQQLEQGVTTICNIIQLAINSQNKHNSSPYF